MRRSLSVAAALMALMVGACAPSGAEPGGPDNVLIRLEEIGGFLPFEMTLAQGPTFTLTTDGRLLSMGAVPAIYPGPLVYPYFVSQLTPGEVNQIKGIIGRIGLPDMDDVTDNSAQGMVADAGSTRITYWDSNGEHRFTVYALGIVANQTAAARSLAELRGILSDLSFRHEPTPYQPERIRVFAGESMLSVEEPFIDVRPWPLPDNTPSSWDRVDFGWVCKGFDGDLLGAFLNATQVTRWTNPEGGTGLTLFVRPLHPGETDCP